jgi:hypothetical protein
VTDTRVVRTVVYFLGTAALALIAGLLWLVHSVIARDQPTAESIAMISSVGTLAGTTLGALGALLVSTRSGPTEAAPVTVVNKTSDPVPVDAVPDATPPPDKKGK